MERSGFLIWSKARFSFDWVLRGFRFFMHLLLNLLRLRTNTVGIRGRTPM